MKDDALGILLVLFVILLSPLIIGILTYDALTEKVDSTDRVVIGGFPPPGKDAHHVPRVRPLDKTDPA